MSGRVLSYSRPADVLELMREGFLTIEEGREKHRKAGGSPLISRRSSNGTGASW